MKILKQFYKDFTKFATYYTYIIVFMSVAK